MRTRLFSAAASSLAAVGAALVLAGCTASAHASLTDSPKHLGSEVADALTKQVGQKAQADCGDDQIDLIDGNVIHCRVWNAGEPMPDQVADAKVTLSDVHGTKYHLDVAVAQDTIDSSDDLPDQTK